MTPNSQFSSSALIVILIIAGCATPPKPTPTPRLNPSLLEGGTTVTGSGVPDGLVDVLLDGIPVAQGTVATNGTFDLEVPALAAEQVVTATQTVGEQNSLPSPPVVVERAALTQIEIHPVLPITIKQGQAHPFNARGTFSTGKTEDPLPGVTWKNKNPNVITINTEGMVTGVKAGKSTIQASRDGVQSSLATITVTPLPPIITGSLKAGDTTVRGTAEPSASIQIMMNGAPLGATVLANLQGQWQTSGLPSLEENDQVTSTQTFNSVQSEPSTVVKVLPNNPPAFDLIGDQRVRLGETLSMNLTATDPDGDEVTFEATSQPLPANSTLDARTGLFTFTPAADQVGATTFTFLVTDGNLAHEETVTVKVAMPKNVLILLDNPDGTVGMINVTNLGGTQVLDKAGQAIKLGSSDDPPSEPFILKEEEIQEVFKNALESKPEDPLKFILYFESDTTKLSDQSIHQLPEILSIIAGRAAPDIGVIGHTDRTASDDYNHQLSLRRANAIRNTIVTGGIDSQVVEVTGHGENNPLVHTPDDVNEPLNRRVEIIIR